MRIALMTTWDVKCGIAEYSRRLAHALVKEGHEVIVLSNYNANIPKEHVNYTRVREFQVESCWSWVGRATKHHTECDWELIDKAIAECDVVHIQYESFLWYHEYFKTWWPSKPTVITYHSTCIEPSFPRDKPITSIVHDKTFPMPGVTIVPMGIPFRDEPTEERRDVLFSFGLARNNDEFCQEAVRVYNREFNQELKFETSYGNHKWLSDKELMDKIHGAKFTALIYPPTPANVSSSAACQAISSKRPVFVSDTKWFNHVRDAVNVVSSPTEMANIMALHEGLMGDWLKLKVSVALEESIEKLVDERSMKSIAKRHVEIYEDAITKP